MSESMDARLREAFEEGQREAQKFLDLQILEIAEMFERGLSVEEIARELNILPEEVLRRAKCAGGYMFSWVRSGFREQSLQEKMKCKNFGYTEGHEDGYADGYAACFLKNFATSYFNGVQDGKKDLTQTIKNHFHKAVHLVRAEDVPIETVAETTDIPETLVEVFTAN